MGAVTTPAWIACCIPMLVIAVALVLAGVVSAGFLLVAAACTWVLRPGGAGDRRSWSHKAG